MEAIALYPILKSVPMSDHNENREQHYKDSLNDARRMREQLDILSGKVGELVTAIKGNDMGTEGVVGQIKTLRAEQELLKKRLDDIEQSTAKKNAYLGVAIGTVGLFLGTIIKVIIDHLFKH
jgi:regulator of replication initiation timing